MNYVLLELVHIDYSIGIVPAGAISFSTFSIVIDCSNCAREVKNQLQNKSINPNIEIPITTLMMPIYFASMPAPRRDTGDIICEITILDRRKVRWTRIKFTPR